MIKSELTKIIKSKALEIGFDKVGVAEAEMVESSGRLTEWLRKGFHGTMSWMEDYFDKRTDPRELFPGAKSVVCLALNYYAPSKIPDDPGIGKISRYAWGDDYHEIVKDKLHELLGGIRVLDPTIRGKCCVDTSPMMDKYWAAKSGIGWQGKHSNVITRDLGSWIFLGEIIIDRELEYDMPIEDFCGTCSLCIGACPTGAITEPYIVDSNKCISYFTIEYRGDDLPGDMRPKFENWIYGCDICQDVCPWNEKFSKPTENQTFYPREENTNQLLTKLQNMPEEEFKKRFKNSPVKRTKYKGLMRNIRFVLGQG